jgi:hypothetical protein
VGPLVWSVASEFRWYESLYTRCNRGIDQLILAADSPAAYKGYNSVLTLESFFQAVL